jgi:hypothetical protein
VSGARVWALAIDPQTPSTVYAGVSPYGSNLSGVLKSTDGGASWTAVNNGLPPRTVARALAIDPEAPLTLYAGTDGGVFKSTDGGANWSAMNEGPTNPSVHALVIKPLDLYAGTYGGGVFGRTVSRCHPHGRHHGRWCRYRHFESAGNRLRHRLLEPYTSGTTLTLTAAPAARSLFAAGMDAIRSRTRLARLR